MKSKKGRVLLLISMLISIAYMAYSISYWGGVNTTVASDAEAVGSGLATVIAFPHLVSTGVGLLLNILAYFTRSRGMALAAAILYCVAMVLMPLYFFFVVIQAILCFIAFARMKNRDLVTA